ncbi:thermonuclease family protein [Thalassotalea agarivorans]|uniref:Nuclease homologue n=1 Tax=Thalassotalea agarivorans TaxID=349064 RepID=A0A1I0EP64_THASX|nr:thermonuclease family protein [Thalassotalea agarivorans]SET47045.1 nuclease homologue [Thalassotalea agarivorans]
MRQFLYGVLLCLACSVNAKQFGNVYVSQVVSVYDADTFRVNLQNFPDIAGKNMPIRVNGVDAPEIRGKCTYEKALAKKAKAFAQALLLNAKEIELKNMQRGKYFRFIADVYIDGKNLANLLIEHNLARPYQGGKRQSWCNQQTE